MTLRHSGSPTHPIPDEVERIGASIIDSAVKVHRSLGPGLLESVYHVCLAHELTKRGWSVVTKPRLPIEYDGRRLESGLEPDMIVEGKVIVEVKAVESIHPIHKAQVMTYLKLSGRSLGYLLNFNVERMHSGMKRFINTPAGPSQEV